MLVHATIPIASNKQSYVSAKMQLQILFLLFLFIIWGIFVCYHLMIDWKTQASKVV